MKKGSKFMKTSDSRSVRPVVSPTITSSAECTTSDSILQSEMHVFTQSQQTLQRRKRSSSSQQASNQISRGQSSSVPVFAQTSTVDNHLFYMSDNPLSIPSIQNTIVSQESSSQYPFHSISLLPGSKRRLSNSKPRPTSSFFPNNSSRGPQTSNQTPRDQSSSVPVFAQTSTVGNNLFPMSDNQIPICSIRIITQKSTSQHPSYLISPSPGSKRRLSNSPNNSSQDPSHIFKSQNSSLDCKDSLTKVNVQKYSSLRLVQNSQNSNITLSPQTSYQAKFQQCSFQNSPSCVPYSPNSNPESPECEFSNNSQDFHESNSSLESHTPPHRINICDSQHSLNSAPIRSHMPPQSPTLFCQPSTARFPQQSPNHHQSNGTANNRLSNRSLIHYSQHSLSKSHLEHQLQISQSHYYPNNIPNSHLQYTTSSRNQVNESLPISQSDQSNNDDINTDDINIENLLNSDEPIGTTFINYNVSLNDTTF